MRSVSHLRQPDLVEAYQTMESGAFPEFMLHDDIWNQWFPLVVETFGDLQLYLLDEEVVVGVLNTVPIAWDGTFEDLPTSEHDVLRRGPTEAANGVTPNTLVGIQIAVAETHTGTGVAAFAIAEARRLCAQRHYRGLIVPIRPTLKCLYPTVAFERYIDWTRDDGMPFDPWIRAQVRHGAHRIGVCAEPMTFEGTVAQWEQWTGLAFPESGEYVIEGALDLLHIDVDADHGRLGELNVWYHHDMRHART